MIAPHKDRSAGLAVFGLIQVVLGIVCAFFLLVTAASAEILTRRGGPNVSHVNVAQGLLFYALGAFYFIAVGIGSFRGRRWARALAAAVSAIWTIGGVFVLAVLFIVLPSVMVLVPPSQETAMKTVVFTFTLLFMILLPLVLTLFYGSRNTGLTCDERDPVIRWTDRVPVPVLALCVFLAWGALAMLINLAKPVYVFFGYVMTGAPAALTVVAFAILFAYLAVQVYRLKESAWWVLLLLHAGAGAMSVLALSHANLAEVYRQSGMLTPQVQAMHLERVMSSAGLWGVLAAGWIGYLCFLIWVRRYFAAPAPAAT